MLEEASKNSSESECNYLSRTEIKKACNVLLSDLCQLTL